MYPAMPRRVAVALSENMVSKPFRLSSILLFILRNLANNPCRINRSISPSLGLAFQKLSVVSYQLPLPSMLPSAFCLLRVFFKKLSLISHQIPLPSMLPAPDCRQPFRRLKTVGQGLTRFNKIDREKPPLTSPYLPVRARSLHVFGKTW